MKTKKLILRILIIGAIIVGLQIYFSLKNIVFADDTNSTENTLIAPKTPVEPQKTDIATLKNKINTSVHTYNGKKRKPYVFLYDGDTTLKQGQDYTVTYKNNKNTGRGQIIVTGKGNYTGTIKKYFYIAPKATKITKVESSADFKKATITWNADKTATGYKIYMATKKDGEYKAIKTIKNKKVVSYTKKGLKAKKQYFFKVRTYTYIKSIDTKVYSKKYSNTKARGSLLAEVTLTARASSANRKFNLKKASNTISGLILKPGEIFNWFKVVGPASGARGYKMASVFKNGKVDKGYGGGVCQVSSTLYQAAIKAGLGKGIIERHIHSRPVTYTKLGNDATVSYGVQNLKFKNVSNYSIKIVMYAEGESTTCKIYSLAK